MAARVNKAKWAKKQAPPQKTVLKQKKGTKNTYKQSTATQKKSLFAWPRKKPQIGQGALSGAKGIAIFLAYIFAGSALMFALFVGSISLYTMATTSDYFATKHVDIIGNVRLSQQMVRDLAEVKIGDNSLDVNIGHIEQKLMQTPWVEDVSVRRILPDRFLITVKERMPSFWIKREGVLYYADVEGKPIAPVETSHFMSLPTLEVEPGLEAVTKDLPLYLQDLKAGRLPVEFGAISALRLSQAKGVELYLDDREILLCIALDNWKKNLQRLSITIGDLARRKELAAVREVRAYDGNVWVIKSL